MKSLSLGCSGFIWTLLNPRYFMHFVNAMVQYTSSSRSSSRFLTHTNILMSTRKKSCVDLVFFAFLRCLEHKNCFVKNYILFICSAISSVETQYSVFPKDKMIWILWKGKKGGQLNHQFIFLYQTLFNDDSQLCYKISIKYCFMQYVFTHFHKPVWFPLVHKIIVELSCYYYFDDYLTFQAYNHIVIKRIVYHFFLLLMFIFICFILCIWADLGLCWK